MPRQDEHADARPYLQGVSDVSVVVSDPSSFVNERGPNTFAATVLATDGDLLLLVLAGQHYVANSKGDAGVYSLIPVSGGPGMGRASLWTRYLEASVQRSAPFGGRTILNGPERSPLSTTAQ
jgi:hypothetical protein